MYFQLTHLGMLLLLYLGITPGWSFLTLLSGSSFFRDLALLQMNSFGRVFKGSWILISQFHLSKQFF